MIGKWETTRGRSGVIGEVGTGRVPFAPLLALRTPGGSCDGGVVWLVGFGSGAYGLLPTPLPGRLRLGSGAELGDAEVIHFCWPGNGIGRGRGVGRRARVIESAWEGWRWDFAQLGLQGHPITPFGDWGDNKLNAAPLIVRCLLAWILW